MNQEKMVARLKSRLRESVQLVSNQRPRKFWTASILDAPTDIATTSDVIYISGQLLDTKRKYGHPVCTMKGHDYNIMKVSMPKVRS